MAEALTTQLDIVTPQGSAYSGPCSFIVLSGTLGELGVLPRHAPLVTTLEVGETRIRDDQGNETRFATGQGYAEVAESRCLVLVDSAVIESSIDVAAARKALEAARATLANLDETAETSAEQQELLMEARMRAIEAENKLKIAGE